jgi:hypothetical protein
MRILERVAIVAMLLALASRSALARPIAYADATTLMGEWSPDARELSVFHAPRHWWSAGLVHLIVDDTESRRQHQVDLVRGNLLVRRWNLPKAQGNAYVWGGVGRGRGREFGGSDTAWNAGFQLDYETLGFYSMLKSDWHRTSSFQHRMDTAQLGVALYAHRWDELATWVVIQGKQMRGDFDRGAETVLLFRFFRKTQWLEAGVTDDGGFTLMFMTNF